MSMFALLVLLASTIHPLYAARPTQFALDRESKRAITIADSIQMTRVVSSFPAVFSPNGKKLVIIVTRGNLEQNTVDYSLLFWTTERLLQSLAPEVLLTMSSSSRRAGIEELTWLSDNVTLVFMGEDHSGVHQLFSFNVETRVFKKIPSRDNGIVAFSVTPDGTRISYLGEINSQSLWDDAARKEGIVVSTQSIVDLLEGKSGLFGGLGYPLFISSPDGADRALRTQDQIRNYFRGKPVISPDGKYILIATEVSEIPQAWKNYTDPDIRRLTNVASSHAQATFLWRYELVNALTGESRILLNSPLGPYGSEVAWAPDSRSVVITRVFLPWETMPDADARKSKSFTVEVNVYTGAITMLSDDDLYGVTWDEQHNGIISHVMKLESNTFFGIGKSVSFRRNGNGWLRAEETNVGGGRPDIVLEEDMHTPPKLCVIDPATHRKQLLLDLNPQFDRLNFARVEEILWKGTDGHEVKGGLFYPVNYIPGKRYPLVIQTHGWSPKRFMIDGPFSSGYAAQALASDGIMVLQADDSNLRTASTLSEAPREVATYEGAIDYLNEKALIDPDRVGIIGFSRSCFFVKYALTHSKYRFAAAAITDGVDQGYFQYIQFLNRGSSWWGEAERVNGGAPWRDGLKSWLERSPGFNIDRVETPMRIVASSPGSLLGEWEWFALLTRMGKPVEMLYLKDAGHEISRPWDRIISQQGNEEWFRFWLKGEEDADSTTTQQYARWRKLRELAQPR